MPEVSVHYEPFKGASVNLFPAPFISRSFEPVEAGAMRLGFVENYNINGFMPFTGNMVTDINGFNALNVFSKSPGVLSISSDGNNEFFKKTGFIVSFSIPQHNFASNFSSFSGSGLFPYSVKFKAFEVLENIKSPSFEYSFAENEDRSVSLEVKISAQGLVSIYDAQSFVEDMASTYDLTGFQPIYIITGSNWSLLSSKKNIDRNKFVYSLERSYICVPSGYINSGFPFSETTKVSQGLSEYGDEYPSFEFDTNLKILADSGKDYQESKAWSSFESILFSDKNYLEEISKHYLSRYGALNLDNFLLNNISISKNIGGREINLKFSLLSGKASDFSGYFNYSISTEEDLSLGERSMSLDGEFISKGDLTNRKAALENWMLGVFTPEGAGQLVPQTSQKFYDFVHNLTGLASGFTSGASEINKIAFTYDSGLAQFKLNCSLDSEPRIAPDSEMFFSVDVQASVPIYKFVPAANIEGHFIIQDLQCITAENAKIQINGKSNSVQKLNNHFGTGVLIIAELFNKFIKKDLGGVNKSTNYINLVPESLSISSGLADASFSIDYGVMYSGNKNYNHISFLGIPAIGANQITPKADASRRTKHRFGR